MIGVEHVDSFRVHLVVFWVFRLLKQDYSFVLLIKDVQNLLLLLCIVLTPEEKSLFVECLHVRAEDKRKDYRRGEQNFNEDFAVIIIFRAH